MAKRTNSIAHRFSKMKGLPYEEKSLMQRIGNLLDVALNNRLPSNPFEPSKSRQNRRLPPPSNIFVKTGIKSVKLTWDAIDSSILLRYEIEFLNVDTGVSVTKTSFTNEIIFKGEAGSFKAKIKAVGRNGDISPIKEVEFGIGADIMFIEGAKNGATELGTIVQDNVSLLSGYSLFVWGSVILDKYIAGTSNETVVFELYRAEEADASINDAVLIEQITLYPATESSSDLDDNAQGGLIVRPLALRPGSFETSQSVMFTPISIATEDNGKTVTYFLKSTNRSVEADEVCLSLVIWAGAEGIGSRVPGDPFVPPLPDVFPNHNCVYTNCDANLSGYGPVVTDARYFYSEVDNTYRLMGNSWTIGVWFRPDEINADAVPDLSGVERLIFSARTRSKSFPFSTKLNSISIGWSATRTAAGGPFHGPVVVIGDPSGSTKNWVGRATYNTTTGKSAFFPNGNASHASRVNGAWHFLVVTFKGSNESSVDKVHVYVNGIEFSPLASLTTTDDPILMDDTQDMSYMINAEAESFLFEGHFRGTNRNVQVSNARMYQLGIWNTNIDRTTSANPLAIDLTPIIYLYNSGLGAEVDWRVNSADGLTYPFAENLIHLNQFGAAIAVTDPQSNALRNFTEDSSGLRSAPGRDLGNHLFRGDMSFTRDGLIADSAGKYSFSNTTFTTNIYSPDGELGTTLETETYPGSTL